MTTITQLANSTTSGTQSKSQTASQAATSASPVSQAMQKVEARIQAQLDSTSAQLSSFGKLKSSVSSAQLAAQALGKLSTTSTSADVLTAANKFITSFNAALGIAKSTATQAGSSTAEAGSASRISADLARVATANPAAMDALRHIGFKRAVDGTLTLDATKFAAAQKADPAGVQSALAKIGHLVDATATKELATDGNVSDAMDTLNQRNALLKKQQSTMLSLVQTLSSNTQSNTSNGYTGYGLSAYLSNN